MGCNCTLGRELQAQEDAIKAIAMLIQAEDGQMEILRNSDPSKLQEKFCYILRLTKALSMVQGKIASSFSRAPYFVRLR